MNASHFEKEVFMRNKFVFFSSIVALTCVISGCGVNVSRNAISEELQDSRKILGVIGGTEAQSSDDISRHVVLIRIEERLPNNQTEITSATGVIISNRFIVTAAHTFANIKIKSGSQEAGPKAYMSFGIEPGSSLKQEFFASDFLNKSAAELSDPAYLMNPNNMDYVFIRIPSGIPQGFSKIGLIGNKNDINVGDKIKLAGYGQTNNQVWDYKLRTLNLNVSATDVNAAVLTPVPNLNANARTYFLEMATTGSQRASHGDSGGPLYYEIHENGKTQLALAGIHTNHKAYNSTTSNCRQQESELCKVADYGLRVDAFFEDSLKTARLLANPSNG